MTARTYDCPNCGTIYLDPNGNGRACGAQPSAQDYALRSQIAQLAGRENVYSESEPDHIKSISAALDRLDAVRDYIEDTDPDDWQVAFERLAQIVNVEEPIE